MGLKRTTNSGEVRSSLVRARSARDRGEMREKKVQILALGFTDAKPSYNNRESAGCAVDSFSSFRQIRLNLHEFCNVWQISEGVYLVVSKVKCASIYFLIIHIRCEVFLLQDLQYVIIFAYFWTA